MIDTNNVGLAPSQFDIPISPKLAFNNGLKLAKHIVESEFKKALAPAKDVGTEAE